MRTLYRHLFLTALCACIMACRQGRPRESDTPERLPAVASGPSLQPSSYWQSVPAPVGFVNDFDSVFTAAQRATLDSICTSWKTQTTGEICIVTLPPSAMPADSFDAFINRLSNDWGVGSKEADNGLVIGISKGYHKMRIATGKGLERKLSDAQAEGIIQQSFIPAYRRGDYYSGTLNGLNAIIKLLRKMKP